MTTFILVYRLPGEGWARRADVPLQDAQRAIRLVRANAGRLGVDPARIGVLGSSAGGHVAGSLATRFDAKVYRPVDSYDELSARPDLAGLLYPVATMGADAHVPSLSQLLGNAAGPVTKGAYSPEKHVPADASPTFLCAAGDDRVVSPVNSLDFYRSLWRAGIKAELHMFQKGATASAACSPPRSRPRVGRSCSRKSRGTTASGRGTALGRTTEIRLGQRRSADLPAHARRRARPFWARSRARMRSSEAHTAPLAAYGLAGRSCSAAPIDEGGWGHA